MGAPVQPGPGQPPFGSQSGFRPSQPLQPPGTPQPAIQQQRNPLSPTIANARPLSPQANNMPVHQFNNNPAAAPAQPRPMGPQMGAPGNLGPQPQAPTGRRAYPSQPAPQQQMPQMMGHQGVPGPGFNPQQNPSGQQPNMGPPGPQLGQPQQYVQPATVPQFGALKPGPPQFGGLAGPVQPGYSGQNQPAPIYGQQPGPGFQSVGPPAFGGQSQSQAGYPGGAPMNQLQNGMQNMNMGSGSMPRNPAAPVPHRELVISIQNGYLTVPPFIRPQSTCSKSPLPSRISTPCCPHPVWPRPRA
ncbi:hypothetical protein BC830DRAFT_29902 [Chytriomyces sp. MP71]|nr:hypothetical protein BC830DRAFT_29902 [Chytriomyces sp. MP71]